MRATVPPRPRRQQPTKWSDETLLEAHALHVAGMSWPQVAVSLLGPSLAWKDEHLRKRYAARIDRILAKHGRQ